ncbi:hypothetical protein P4S91_22240 [Aneurinibacillus aneurinilyticus]|uniref:hypothetical protein n=1 Tax=Aneurinibacillus aneurinilyticus TaxID=1391 RepID=UPI002E24818C|nr:hypothetical protein [Aneurinibacillus aneurinilyticus]MED0725607.1 hypothetical protein [Aneurinibacillus aneurinilyticus]
MLSPDIIHEIIEFVKQEDIGEITYFRDLEKPKYYFVGFKSKGICFLHFPENDSNNGFRHIIRIALTTEKDFMNVYEGTYFMEGEEIKSDGNWIEKGPWCNVIENMLGIYHIKLKNSRREKALLHAKSLIEKKERVNAIWNEISHLHQKKY